MLRIIHLIIKRYRAFIKFTISLIALFYETGFEYSKVKCEGVCMNLI